MGVAHGTEVEKSRIAVIGFDPIHFSGYGIQGFVPGNPGKPTGPSGSGSFERVKKAIRGVDPLTVGVSAGTQSRFAFPVIGLNAHDPVSFHMHFHIAGSAAVAAADTADDSFFVALVNRHHILQIPFHHNRIFVSI
jgi:hypothetical protein